MGDPTAAEIEAAQVLIIHGRTRIEGCDCGWGMDGSKLGQSHALHVWRELQRALLPAHDARVRAEAWRHAAQEIRDRLGAVTRRRELSYGDGASDAARLLENMAGDLAQTYAHAIPPEASHG